MYGWPGGGLVIQLLLALLWGVTSLQAEALLLTGATVHTVSGETMAPGQVLMEDGKIVAVGQSLSATGAKTVVLDGLHLYPGLIALNTDLGLVEIEAVRATVDAREVGRIHAGRGVVDRSES